MLPAVTNTPWLTNRATSAGPMAFTARAALSRELTGPSYSSTTTGSPPPRAELWS